MLGLNRIFYIPKLSRVLRAYPAGLGDSIHEVYMAELAGPAHGHLRHREVPHGSDLELFRTMELGDTWPDADLWDCFAYLYKSHCTRTPL